MLAAEPMSRPNIVPGDPVPIDTTITRHADGQETIIVADGREMLTKESRAPFGRSIRFAVRYLGPDERHAPLDLSTLKVPDAPHAEVYTSRAREHSQRCFDVQTRRCVCGIENRDVRVREAAPEMEELLRRIIRHADDGGECPQCGGFDATVPEKDIRALLARIGPAYPVINGHLPECGAAMADGSKCDEATGHEGPHTRG
jgi:hypothetical protein